MGRPRSRARADRPAADALDDRGDVLGRGAAAAADDADAVALDELLQRFRERLRLLGEDRLAVGALQRQAGVRDAGDRDGAELAEEADRVAHVLRAGRAVQPDHVDLQRLERASAPPRCRCRAASCRRWAAARPRCGSAATRPFALKASRAPKTAALTSRMSCAVSMISRSAPPSIRPRRLLGEDLDELAEADLPERGLFGGRQVAGRADRAGDEAVLARGLAGDLRRPWC